MQGTGTREGGTVNHWELGGGSPEDTRLSVINQRVLRPVFAHGWSRGALVSL